MYSNMLNQLFFILYQLVLEPHSSLHLSLAKWRNIYNKLYRLDYSFVCITLREKIFSGTDFERISEIHILPESTLYNVKVTNTVFINVKSYYLNTTKKKKRTRMKKRRKKKKRRISNLLWLITYDVIFIMSLCKNTAVSQSLRSDAPPRVTGILKLGFILPKISCVHSKKGAFSSEHLL